MNRATVVALLGRLHAAQGVFYAGGGEEDVRAVLTEDIAWHVPGRSVIAGDYHGIDSVLGYFVRRREVAGRTFRMYPGDVLVGDGDHAAVLIDGSAITGGAQRRWSTVGLYRIRGQRVAACWLLPLDAEAFDAIWAWPLAT